MSTDDHAFISCKKRSSQKDDGESTKTGKTSSTDCNRRQNHSEIEKRRRDKMNTYIMELSNLIPVRGSSRKLDKLTVLRIAVQHVKSLKGSLNCYTQGQYKPSFLSDTELKKLILSVADGFVLVVGCDHGHIMYVSESVKQTLQYNRSELLGKSWFDILHPNDLSKIKEQLSYPDVNRRDRMVDAKTMLPMRSDISPRLSCLSPGSRRSFFCRMQCNTTPVYVNQEQPGTSSGISSSDYTHQLLSIPEKKYAVIHFNGYLKQYTPTTDTYNKEVSEEEDFYLYCLVAVGRVHTPLFTPRTDYPNSSKYLPNKPLQYASKHTVEGKFVFIDPSATLIIGWLPQELLGTTMYEYFHQDDISSLVEKHKLTLKCSELCSTQVYRFRIKDGSYLGLRSHWKTFRNPWTNDIEFIISTNCFVTSNTSTFTSSVVTDSTSTQSIFPCGEFSTREQNIAPISSSKLVDENVKTFNLGRKVVEDTLYTPKKSISSTFTTEIAHFDDILQSASATGPFADAEEKLDPNSELSIDSDSAQKEKDANHNKNLIASQTSQPVNDGEHPDFAGRNYGKDDTNDSDEAAMAVVMSLLEAEAGLGEPVDFSHFPWPLP